MQPRRADNRQDAETDADSDFANATPGMYVFLGNGPPGVDPKDLPANHSPLFDMYEPSMEIGVRVFSNLVVDYLQGKAD